MAKGFKNGSGGTKQYKPSTLPPQVISLSVKGKYLAPTDNIEVTILFANIPTASREYLSEFVVAYDKGRIPQTPFEGQQVAIPKTTSETVSFTFVLPIDYLGEVGFRVFPKNPDKMYQTVNFPNINSVMTKFAKFTKPTYTGQHVFGSDGTYDWIQCLSSGTLTLSEGTYDVHAVGAGGGKANPRAGRSGSGGGHTATKKDVPLSGQYSVNIGVGGVNPGQSGTPSSIDGVISANGGTTSYIDSSRERGGSGGSGGGAGGIPVYRASVAGTGGSDGSDGGVQSPISYNFGGIGQHSTTRDFGEPSGTLRAGGGGGAGASGDSEDGTEDCTPADGGAGGGGSGQWYPLGNADGKPNTGGGAGPEGKGGSGIVIVRWKKVA